MGRRKVEGLPGGMAKQERRHQRWKKDDADAPSVLEARVRCVSHSKHQAVSARLMLLEEKCCLGTVTGGTIVWELI